MPKYDVKNLPPQKHENGGRPMKRIKRKKLQLLIFSPIANIGIKISNLELL